MVLRYTTFFRSAIIIERYFDLEEKTKGQEVTLPHFPLDYLVKLKSAYFTVPSLNCSVRRRQELAQPLFDFQT
jgi:hypothetical protein